MAACMTRMVPTFFIIGERKCGTSSLFRYLADHPQVLPGKRKEPNFFAHPPEYLRTHWEEYLANFPETGKSSATLIWPELNAQGILYEEEVTYVRTAAGITITGEASANTFFDVPPEIVKEFLPEIKLIVLFRNPVDRAYSHYRMLRRFTDEGRVIGWQLGTFEEELDREMAMIRDGNYGQLLAPSSYILKLPAWVEHFGWENIRILDSQRLDTPGTLKETMVDLYRWLGLEPIANGRYPRYNQAPPEAIPAALRDRLETYFRPYNNALFDYLGYRLLWE